MHGLPLPPPFPPASSFPIPLHPLVPLTPPRSHPSISTPTSLKEGRGSHPELVGVVFVDDVARRGSSSTVMWRVWVVKDGEGGCADVAGGDAACGDRRRR